jgi:hypothetical protein
MLRKNAYINSVAIGTTCFCANERNRRPTRRSFFADHWQVGGRIMSDTPETDRATVACYWRGKTCYCDEKRMPTCDYHEAAEGLPGMCVHNLDRSQPKGSPEEITDFCFHAQARSCSQHNDQEEARRK